MRCRSSVFYFHNIFLLDDDSVGELMEVLCDLLRDPKIEVREATANTLSGIVRCSQRSAILSLSSRFLGVLRKTKIPKRRTANGEETPGYQDALIAARELIDLFACTRCLTHAFPPLLLCRLCRVGRFFTCQRVPVRSSAVHPWHPARDCAQALCVARAAVDDCQVHALWVQAVSSRQVRAREAFSRQACAESDNRWTVHSWQEDQKAFTETQLQDLHDLLMGSSYCESKGVRCQSVTNASGADPVLRLNADA